MIPITKAIFDETDFALIQEPLKSGWVVQGPFVKDFETRFAAFTAFSVAAPGRTTKPFSIQKRTRSASQAPISPRRVRFSRIS